MWDVVKKAINSNLDLPLNQLSPIKSIQKGVRTSSGTVTISAVDVNKAFIISASKASAGTVAATGTLTGTITPVRYNHHGCGSAYRVSGNNNGSFSGSLSGGTTNLTARVYSAVLTNSTTITCDGHVEWQVIEFR